MQYVCFLFLVFFLFVLFFSGGGGGGLYIKKRKNNRVKLLLGLHHALVNWISIVIMQITPRMKCIMGLVKKVNGMSQDMLCE